MSGIKPIAWLVGNDSVGPHALRHTDPKGWKYSAGLMKISDHEVEVARLRAELQNAAKAALDATALACEKEREADALRVNAERYLWLRNPDRDVSLVLDKVTGYVEYHEGTQTGGYSTYEYRAGDELDTAIDAAMGEGK